MLQDYLTPSFYGFNNEQNNIDKRKDDLWIVGLFFNFQRNDFQNLLFSPENLENGFRYILSKKENFKNINDKINYLFVFIVYDIVLKDGIERANVFIDNYGSETTLEKSFIDELKDFDLNDAEKEQKLISFFSRGFLGSHDYEDSRESMKVLESCNVSSARFFLRKMFHFCLNECNEERIFKRGFNHPIDELFNKPFNSLSFMDERGKVNKKYGESVSKERKVSPDVTTSQIPLEAEFSDFSTSPNHVIYNVENCVYMIDYTDSVKCIYRASDQICCLKLSKCGKFFAYGTVDGNFGLLGPLYGDGEFFEKKYKSVSSMVTSVDISLNYDLLIGTKDGIILYYGNGQEDSPVYFKMNQDTINNVCFHPACDFFAVCYHSGLIRIFSVSIRECVRLFNFGGFIPGKLKFSNSGKHLLVVCFNERISVVDIQSGAFNLCEIQAKLVDADFSPNDDMVAIADISGGFSTYPSNKIGTDALIVTLFESITSCVLKWVSETEVRILCRKKL